MIISHVGLRARLRSLNVDDIDLFNSELELSSSYLKKSDALCLPHHDESLKFMVLSMIQTNSALPFPISWVIENEHKQKIGLISLHTFDNRHLVFSYGISLLSSAQGQGYAFEAVNLILKYMFTDCNYFKCVAKTYSFNQSSISLQRKIGFKKEGILRESYFIDGKFEDVVLWGIDRINYKFMHKAQ